MIILNINILYKLISVDISNKIFSVCRTNKERSSIFSVIVCYTKLIFQLLNFFYFFITLFLYFLYFSSSFIIFPVLNFHFLSCRDDLERALQRGYVAIPLKIMISVLNFLSPYPDRMNAAGTLLYSTLQYVIAQNGIVLPFILQYTVVQNRGVYLSYSQHVS